MADRTLERIAKRLMKQHGITFSIALVYAEQLVNFN